MIQQLPLEDTHGAGKVLKGTCPPFTSARAAARNRSMSFMFTRQTTRVYSFRQVMRTGNAKRIDGKCANHRPPPPPPNTHTTITTNLKTTRPPTVMIGNLSGNCVFPHKIQYLDKLARNNRC